MEIPKKPEDMSAEEAEMEYEQTQLDFKHPWHDASNPHHAKAIERMSSLWGHAHPEQVNEVYGQDDIDDQVRIMEASEAKFQGDKKAGIFGLDFAEADNPECEKILRDRWGQNYEVNLALAKDYFQRHYSEGHQDDVRALHRDNASEFVMDMFIGAKGEAMAARRAESESSKPDSVIT